MFSSHSLCCKCPLFFRFFFFPTTMYNRVYVHSYRVRYAFYILNPFRYYWPVYILVYVRMVDSKGRWTEWCDVMWCDVWCDAIRCAVMLCDVIRRYVMWCTVIWCYVMCCDMLWCAVMWCYVMCCDVLWCAVMYIFDSTAIFASELQASVR
jgi:hypothetical protein